MARTPKKVINPVQEFLKEAPQIWRSLYYASLRPLASLMSTEAQSAMKQAVSDVIGKSAFSDVSNYFRFQSAVEGAIQSNLTGRSSITEQLRIKKDGNGYVFNLVGRVSSVLSLSSTMESLPGYSDILASKPTATKKEFLSPIIAALEVCGLPVKHIDGSEEVVLDLMDYTELDKNKHPLGENLSTASEIVSIFKHVVPAQYARGSAAYKPRIGAQVFVDTSVIGQYSLEVDVFFEIKVSNDVFEQIAQSDEGTAKPFLALSWMTEAVRNGLNSGMGRWTTAPAVDLRTTSKLLDGVRKIHGKAKARVNEHGYCICDLGLPMIIPDKNNTEAYMKSVSQPEMSEDGYFVFDSNLEAWANKLILVDWFNDVIVYTDSSGRLRYKFMYGFVPLDKSSEYILMNTPLLDSLLLKDTLTALKDIVDPIVSPDEATKYLDPKGPGAALDGGRVKQTFNSLFNYIRMSTTRLQHTDVEFEHDNPTAMLVKHALGFDLDEVPNDHLRATCAHVAAYIRALYDRRTEINLPVMTLLVGVTWLISSVYRGPEAYAKIKEEGIRKRALMSQAPTLKSFDIPNVDTNNLKGVMPHQAKILSTRFAGVADGSLNAAAGAGKTLMILADILYKKEQHPEWKPLIITKSRLVKSFASEINYFTKGKVNVMSIRPRTLRILKKKHKIDTFEKLLDWVKKLPANTVFLTSYPALRSRAKIYPDLTVPSRVFMQDIALPQFLHIIRLLGFEQVQCDESHLIKNMKSLQAQYAYSVMAQATEKVIASGTQTPNTVVDLLGQGFAISPAIYGKHLNTFKERYNLSSGIVDDDNAAALRKRMQRFLQESTAYKEDWAFVLPDLKDQLVYTDLTPKQIEFYKGLLEAALIELKDRLDGKKPNTPEKEDKPKLDGEEDDDEEDDDEDDDDGMDEDLDEEGKIMQAIDRSLAKVEQFVVSPDTNVDYINSGLNPDGNDLISPLVGLVDGYLDRIYADKTADHSNNKTAIFGINKVASLHIMKYSRHRAKMVHYTAGNEEAIRRFKTESDVWILTADSGGLREGENLQMLSYIFDIQAPWSPGDYEQLVSRMYRPDPKGVYNKEFVYHYWCNARLPNMPGVNTIKLARMIAKAISTARYKYDRDPRWMKVAPRFEDLGLLTMSFDFLINVTPADLQPYLDAWEDFVDWETSLNAENRRKVAQEIEMENPGVKLLDSSGRVLDRNLFVSLAMKEVKSTKTIRGSRKAYVPWDLGITPADVHDMGLVVLGGQKAEAGMYVMTEFGPGIIQRAGTRTCVVEINGLRKVTLSRQSIAIPVSQEGKNKLGKMISDPSVWKAETIGPVETLGKIDPSASLAPKGSISKVKKEPKVAPTIVPKPAAPVTITPKPTKPIGTNPLDAPIPGKQPKPAAPVKKEPKVLTKTPVEEIYTYLVNGYPALVIYDPPEQVYDYGWTEVGDFFTVEFKTWTIAEKFIDALATKFFMTQNEVERLFEEMDAFRKGKAMKLTQRPSSAEVRNFFIAQHRKPTQSKSGKDKVIPYWLAIDGAIKLAFSKASHSPSVLRWVKATKAKNPSITKINETDGFAVRTFSTLKEAADAIREVGQVLDMPEADLRNELRELKVEIDNLRATKKVPSTPKKVEAPVKKPAAKAPVKKPAAKAPVKKTVRKTR